MDAERAGEVDPDAAAAPAPRLAPLAGIRVLDLSRVLAGPWATQILGDLGADVVKVERPDGGDDTRAWGPPYLKDADGRDTDVAAYFLCANRNKRSLTADLATPAGADLVRRLALNADVLVENFKVGGLARYRLDDATLRAEHPGLVYCSITGFGQTGPYADRPGYDLLIQAMGGLMSITGRADGEPGAGPQKVGVALVDVMTGLYAAIAVQAALAERARSGLGQHIDLALLDVQIATLANQASNYLAAGTVPGRLGNAHPSIVPYQDVPTADGDMVLAIGNDGQFARFCTVAGQPEWSVDGRFATNAARVAHRSTLMPLVRQATVLRTTADWMALLDAANVPCGPVNRLDAVFADPHVTARGLAVSLPHIQAGSLQVVANPMRLSATPPTLRTAPPTLGADTAEVVHDWLTPPNGEASAATAGPSASSLSSTAAEEWTRRWLVPVADGRNTMSQRKLSSIEQRGGGLARVVATANDLRVHLVQLTDDRGEVLVAASRHPFKTLA